MSASGSKRSANKKLEDVPGHLLVQGLDPDSELVEREVPEWIMNEALGALDMVTLNQFQEKVLVGLRSGLDLITIWSRGQGRTVGFLVPVLIHLLEQDRPTEKACPTVLIACPTTERGVHLESILNHINFPHAPDKKPRVALLDETDDMEPVNREIDVLIMTGSFMSLALLPKKNPKLPSLNINLGRVELLIVDELCMQHYFYSTETIQLIEHMTRHVCLTKKDLRMLFTGTSWTIQILRIHLLLKTDHAIDPVLIFGSAYNALHYANVHWYVKHCASSPEWEQEKMDQLILVCEAALSENRTTVVVCKTPKIAQRISQYLSEKGKINNILKIPEFNGVLFGLFRKNTDWLGMVYVVSDDALDLLFKYEPVVKDVSCLVHYNVDSPYSVKVPKGEPINPLRYQCLWNRLKKKSVALNEDGVWDKVDVIIHAFVTCEEANFLRLYESWVDCKIKVPLSVKHMGKEKIRSASLTRPFCTTMKVSGFCTLIGCSQRHEIIPKDISNDPEAPKSGELEFKVVKCANPGLYLVRMIRHIEDNENGGPKWATSYHDILIQRMYSLAEHFTKPKNQVHPRIISEGDIYCVLCQSVDPTFPNKMYLRVQAQKIIYHNLENRRPEFVVIFCLDTGLIAKVPAKLLLVLPDEYKMVKNLCVEVVIAGLVPPSDYTPEFIAKSIKVAKTLSEGKIWRGKVLLALRETVWVDRVCLVDDPEVNLKVKLAENKHVMILSHHRHMEIILQRIRYLAPDYPDIPMESHEDFLTETSKQYYKVGDPVAFCALQLSYFEPDVRIVPIMLSIKCWSGPGDMFGVAVMYPEENNLTPVGQLEKGITEWVTNDVIPILDTNGSEAWKLHEAIRTLDLTSVVAVKVQEGKWKRGIIYEIEPGHPRRFSVFLADHGIPMRGVGEATNAIPLLRKFIDSVPFQSVCLRMGHVKPVGEDGVWSDEVLDKFSEIMSSNACFNVIAYNEANPEETGVPCKTYDVILLQTSIVPKQGQEQGKVEGAYTAPDHDSGFCKVHEGAGACACIAMALDESEEAGVGEMLTEEVDEPEPKTEYYYEPVSLQMARAGIAQIIPAFEKLLLNVNEWMKEVDTMWDPETADTRYSNGKQENGEKDGNGNENEKKKEEENDPDWEGMDWEIDDQGRGDRIMHEQWLRFKEGESDEEPGPSVKELKEKAEMEGKSLEQDFSDPTPTPSTSSAAIQRSAAHAPRVDEGGRNPVADEAFIYSDPEEEEDDKNDDNENAKEEEEEVGAEENNNLYFDTLSDADDDGEGINGGDDEGYEEMDPDERERRSAERYACGVLNQWIGRLQL